MLQLRRHVAVTTIPMHRVLTSTGISARRRMFMLQLHMEVKNQLIVFYLFHTSFGTLCHYQLIYVTSKQAGQNIQISGFVFSLELIPRRMTAIIE